MRSLTVTGKRPFPYRPSMASTSIKALIFGDEPPRGQIKRVLSV
jgi:hypothetical protein